MLQHGCKIVPLYLIFMFFVHHGRKIAPVLYIYPSTGAILKHRTGPHCDYLKPITSPVGLESSGANVNKFTCPLFLTYFDLKS